MNMGQMLMQGLTANNPMVAQIMQMKNSGMTPQQALQQMAQSNPQMRQIMQGGNPQPPLSPAYLSSGSSTEATHRALLPS